MKIIYNKIIPFKGFAAIYLFGFLFVREGVEVSERMLRHEAIHDRQAKELLFVGFYVWYMVEWLLWLILRPSRAYNSISFEREAYANQNDKEYLTQRRFWAHLRYFGK